MIVLTYPGRPTKESPNKSEYAGTSFVRSLILLCRFRTKPKPSADIPKQEEQGEEGLTKSAVKKKLKEEEKARKKAEKAAKAKEAEQVREAAEGPVS
jgi:aspartyl-tRNA synthetase